MVEAHDRANEIRGGAASTVTQPLVPVADLHPRQGEEVRDRCAGIADQEMTLTVGQERKITRLQQVRVGIRGFHPALPFRHDMEHHAVLEGRDGHAPGRREFRARVERAAHPQEMQRFTERIRRRRPRGRHASGVLNVATILTLPLNPCETTWTIEHEMATRRHCSAAHKGSQ